MFVIPAIDIRDGKCVRLLRGDYAQETIYADDPVTVLAEYQQFSFPWIHLVDLDGARSGKRNHAELLSSMAKTYTGNVEVGGGIRTAEDIETVLSEGVGRVIMGTALTSLPHRDIPKLWDRFGEQLVAGVDAKDGKVAIHGWKEVLDMPLVDFLLFLEDSGCRRAIVTDIGTDGTLEGPNVALYEKLTDRLDLAVIASGGVGKQEDLEMLNNVGVEAVIVGKAIYEGQVSIQACAQFHQGV